ncbi:MAG: peptidoglycan editing factor PgeF [Clostridia bacterium]|nr:peptidoglycan editing factor PgeF [Clostridia bacterium]MDD4387000.1 peptidoglycan editing factor PgeF [Clostridia bacterium]
MNSNFTNDNITHIKKGNLEYITFNILNKYKDKLIHGFFFKNGGVSKGIYSSLNFRILGNDSKKNVFKNIDIVKKELNLSKVYKAMQAHSDNILILDNNNKSKYEIEKLNNEEYDSYVIAEKDISTIITTADCNPIIIYDPVNNVVANVHSGWKGTIKQIYIKTVKLMNRKYGSKYNDIIVCIGPSINKCCFCSSSLEFKKQFTDIWPNENEYITNKENGEFYIDLPYVIKKDLIRLGLKKENIILSEICTVCNNDVCFSYRFLKKQNELDYATMGTFVELK